MSTKIFVNLPVQDLQRSTEFFTALGYSFNPQFSDDKAGCLVISEHIHIMLLTTPFFQTWTKKEVVDATKATEAIITLSMESRDEVDALMTKMLDAGGTEPREANDMGFMYGRAFEDPDGHIWELFFMDMAAAGAQQG
ncbi:glyoxalase [Pseudonocardiaceae bacterium YIM PH 21723]|nr:glyoxalase [Pseudonocardiaceae bacterium YIM PH 21723]